MYTAVDGIWSQDLPRVELRTMPILGLAASRMETRIYFHHTQRASDLALRVPQPAAGGNGADHIDVEERVILDFDLKMF